MPTSLLLSLASFFNPLAFTTVPGHPAPCRIYNTTFSQHDCGACAAFAMATVASMHMCLGNRTDRIPSPYRLFDCTGSRCSDQHGVSLDDVSAIMHSGVGDLDSSRQLFGLPCSENKAEIQFHTSHGLMVSVADIKTALILTGMPLIGIVSHQLLQEHDTGIFRTGPPAKNGHALVVTGWGSDHWIVQNSWGEGWGDGGGSGRIRFDALKGALELTGMVRRARTSELILMTLTMTGSLVGLCLLEFRRIPCAVCMV